ncbi:MAG: hypothetical protein J0L85_21185, partial [Zoogloea sp.]|nr:hypothetical protein [Zoogloea sp.]
ARPSIPPLRGTRISRSVLLSNPRLIGIWRKHFDETSWRLYAICVFAPHVLGQEHALEEPRYLQAYLQQQARKVGSMVGWALKQIEAHGLQEGEPGALERLETDIRSPLANAYADLFLRADLAIRLLDALWVQGELTDSGHQERTRAVHGAALGILGETRRAHARCRHRIEVQYLGRKAAALMGTRPKPSAHPS